MKTTSIGKEVLKAAGLEEQCSLENALKLSGIRTISESKESLKDDSNSRFVYKHIQKYSLYNLLC